MLKKLAGLGILALLTFLGSANVSQAELVCTTYYGCRPVRYQDGIACTCNSATRNCTECCDISAGYCCTGGIC